MPPTPLMKPCMYMLHTPFPVDPRSLKSKMAIISQFQYIDIWNDRIPKMQLVQNCTHKCTHVHSIYIYMLLCGELHLLAGILCPLVFPVIYLRNASVLNIFCVK